MFQYNVTAFNKISAGSCLSPFNKVRKERDDYIINNSCSPGDMVYHLISYICFFVCLKKKKAENSVAH